MSAGAYLTIIRPVNSLIASGAVAIAGLVAVGLSILEYSALVDLVLACCVVFLFVGAGNSLNDYYDHEVDKINHPERPIPSGLIEREQVLTFAILLFVPAFLLGLFINLEALAIVLISAAVMLSYEKRLKRRGLLGNLQISWLVGSVFLFGGVSVYDGESDALLRVAFLAVLAFFATLGREITKDIEDLKGDRDRVTLPMSMGPRGAANLARAFYAFAIALSLALYWWGALGIFYLGVVVAADAVFIACMIFVMSRPSRSSDLSKMAMVLALVAFLLGGLGI
jgi:geranylgeranylglycerol-phosphate geranylgeranyltransferase